MRDPPEGDLSKRKSVLLCDGLYGGEGLEIMFVPISTGSEEGLESITTTQLAWLDNSNPKEVTNLAGMWFHDQDTNIPFLVLSLGRNESRFRPGQQLKYTCQ